MGPERQSNILHYVLWAVQILLAGVFGLAGFTKVATPIADLIGMGMSYPIVMGEIGTRFIGVSELAGAAGLVLPSALRIAPRLTPAAALGLATVMVLGIGYHVWAVEYPNIVFSLTFGGLAAFVAWGRLAKVPIASGG